MKIIHIISGILLFLLIAVSSASAVDVHLKAINDAKYQNVGIDILVQYDGSSITFKDNSPAALKVVIKEVGIQLPNQDNKIINLPNAWTPSYNFDKGFDESAFGFFNTQVKCSGSTKTNSVSMGVSGTTKQPPWDPNAKGNIFVAHVSWGAVPDVTVGGSGWVGGSIPEFPTIALPVAAILGLMFILQRRKEN